MRSKHCMLVLCMLLMSVAPRSSAVVWVGEAPLFQSVQTASNSQLDSTLAQYYEIYASGFNFDQRIAQAAAENDGHRPSQIEITKSLESKFVEHFPPSQVHQDSSPLIEAGVDNSDLIVMGVPLMSRTLPLQDHTFLFTEYTVRIDQVMTTDHHRFIQPGDTITVSRGGGELMVDGVLVKAVEPAFEQFQLKRPYIFMLHAIPRTDAYRALGSRTFLVENGTVATVSHLEAATEPKRDLEDFLTRVDIAVARKPYRRN